MKFLLLFLFGLTAFSQGANNKKESPEEKLAKIAEQQRDLEIKCGIEAIPFYKQKYVPQAKKEMLELNTKIKRYEAGLAKLSKGSNKYKARMAEFKELQNQVKANKIILVYIDHYVEMKLAYKNEDMVKYKEKLKVCLRLTQTYYQLTKKSFPPFVSEYMNRKYQKEVASLNEQKKKLMKKKPTKRQQASTQ